MEAPPDDAGEPDAPRRLRSGTVLPALGTQAPSCDLVS